ncbi:hypothetical protein CHU94_11365 [Rhodoferax sp. TH121]|uniref:hypothetical protein n=1 Tax=Rhodoferax sp. TH121 TaxID=2022803 RepID=UPI000B97611F|nr:hypothetical protein [Rhodoferax sp. TH121]OYQ39932.1 hypothetical protein CHU94_11365 [Rhodoferax sp. TH121]
MADNSLTIEKLEALATQDVFLANMLRRLTVKTYSDFVEVLYDDLKLATERLEQNPQLHLEDEEDATTEKLLLILFGFQYQASHDAQSGGAVDITVELPKRGFKWIGEAKRFKSVADMREGYLQLSTRYSPGSGSLNLVHGGLIGYLRRSRAAKHVADWKEHFKEQFDSEGTTYSDCNRRGPWGFITEQEHESLGVPFRVWHFCISLHFAPKDKSARSAKKYK